MYKQAILLITAIICCGLKPIQATTYNWDNVGGSGNWMDTLRWTPNGTPNAVDDEATITDGSSLTYTITLDTSIVLCKFRKTNASHNGNPSITPAANETITMDSSDGSECEIYCRYGQLTMNATIILMDNAYLDATTRLNINGDIVGTGNLRTYSQVTSSGRGCFINANVNMTGEIETTSGSIGKTEFNGVLGSNVLALVSLATKVRWIFITG